VKVYLALFVTVFSIQSFAQLKSESFKEAQKSGTATLIIHYFDVPFFSQRKEGVLTGINVDILEDFVKYVSEKKGVAISIKYNTKGIDFKTMYNNVKGSEGLVMGVGAIAGTEERRKEIGLTKPYITFYNVLVTHSHVPTLDKLESVPALFKGFAGYTMKGSKMEEAMMAIKSKHYPSMPIKSLPTVSDYISQLVTDKNGFGYLMLPNYIEALKSGKSLKRHPIGDTPALPICFVLPKGSDWIDIFNEFLSANGGYTASARYRSILVKHMGETGVKLLNMNI
jgi:putative glutamine transport system substrate-binding protein